MDREEALTLSTLLLFCVMALAIDASATVPPEIPQQRTSEIFSPFEFAAPTGDYYGDNVLSAGGPACLGYARTFDLRQTGSPSTTTPLSANFLGYRNILRSAAGLMYSVGHGNTSIFTVEAYEADSAGHTAAINAAQSYIAAGYGTPSEITWGKTDDGYWAVAVTGAWIQRMLTVANTQGLNPRHDIVVQQGCKTFTESLAFVNLDGLTRDYAGQTANVGISTTINPSFYNQISSAIFNNMSGIRNDATGSYGNDPFVATFGVANSLSPLPLFFQTGYIADPVLSTSGRRIARL